MAPSVVDPRLASAMSHPTRVYALKLLCERTATPREIATELGEPLNNVTYHIKQLLGLGCIELVETRSTQGGRVVEHLYRGTRRPYFDADGWNVLNDKEKSGIVAAIMRMVSEDIASAMSGGTFNEREDNHLSRWPLILDEDGWQEVIGVLRQAAENLLEVEQSVAARRADGATTDIHAKVEILHFCSPPPAPTRAEGH
jgi:DNA-binding transcriptional ArsR family regulator